MIQFLRASASGMLAQQAHLDVIAHNMANVNTTAFKYSRVTFEDLLYGYFSLTGDLVPTEQQAPRSIFLGSGVRTSQVTRQFDQGDIEQTNDPLHLAIVGEGFFIVQLPDGTAAYTRAGAFRLDSERRLVTTGGAIVQPAVVIPPDARHITVDGRGTISAHVGEEGEIAVVGEVQLARFPNVAGLLNIGENLYAATNASGPPLVGYPGDETFGTIFGGGLERSNVDLTVEMSNMILAQRAYQLNSRTLQTIDEMLGMANNLRR